VCWLPCAPKTLGISPQRAQANGRTIQEAHVQAVPLEPLDGLEKLAGQGGQPIRHPGQRQAAAGGAEAGGGPGTDRLGGRSAVADQRIGPAPAEVLHDGCHRAVGLEALPDHGPEGDEGTPEAFVETHRVMREPVGQGGQGEETGEEREHLREGDLRARRRGRGLSSRKHPARLKELRICTMVNDKFLPTSSQ